MKTERLIIDENAEDDYAQLLEIYNVADNMKFILTGKSNWTLDELKNKWEIEKYNSIKKTGFKIVKLKSNNNVIGECGLLKTNKPITEELEIGYMIDKKYWGMGYCKEMLNELVNYAFEVLITNCIKAGMYKENIRSAKLLEKIGFELVVEGISKSGIHFREYKLMKEKFIRLGKAQ